MPPKKKNARSKAPSGVIVPAVDDALDGPPYTLPADDDYDDDGYGSSGEAGYEEPPLTPARLKRKIGATDDAEVIPPPKRQRPADEDLQAYDEGTQPTLLEQYRAQQQFHKAALDDACDAFGQVVARSGITINAALTKLRTYLFAQLGQAALPADVPTQALPGFVRASQYRSRRGGGYAGYW